jgi:hypothetical protein
VGMAGAYDDRPGLSAQSAGTPSQVAGE